MASGGGGEDGGSYPPRMLGDGGMGRTSSDLCALRLRGVFAGAGPHSGPGDGSSCYASAIAAVNAYSFDDVPWGQVYFMDYGGSAGTPATTCSSSDSLVTPSSVGLVWAFLASFSFSLNIPSTDPSTHPWDFQVMKFQMILPPTWCIHAYTGETSSGPGFRCVANDYDTNPSDADYPGVIFYDTTDGGGSRLVEMPVPSWGDGCYVLVPCDNCTPET